MARLSSVFIEAAYSRKRKRNQKPKQKKHKGLNDDLSANKQNSSCNNLQGLNLVDLSANSMDNNNKNINDNGIDNLSDDMLVAVLSRLSLKQAARTSVLSCRWRYLWTSAFSTLEFKDGDIATGKILMKRVKFKSWVNCVLKAYQAQPVNLIDSLIIRFFNICPQLTLISTRRRRALDSWIHFAMQKELVQRFELDLTPRDSCYIFPNVDKLSSQIRCLRSLRLVSVSIKDEAVYHILALCSLLEHLCINSSSRMRNLRVVDPLPNLKALEIIECYHIRSLEISCANLVSLTFHGKTNVLKLLEIPNLRELNLGKDLGDSLIFEPNQHSSYSVQIVKLVLDHRILRLGRANIGANPNLPRLCSLKRFELQVYSFVGRSLLFFTSLIKASPQLHEFRIQIIDPMEGA
ncbi:putative F-box/LRR-repeat protein at5g02700 [Phtheirospermum japonicum]|uniref:Putative F-box/LRR-repeat protein at5g02700 n=1 Tax=Phtheirospermum japonicum TaxID=374723 RepID=A0A830BPJ8_9LAMI|nr:putative F-box/LRR-repeat protein at5g02700 [Phtheirospermum japonicum]